ncbi:MAG TPA: hypothetical protein VE172_00960 [Stackebrandtia sp.]|jgi:hypothetical protein|uniref:hypothetical protein n=1 Tax=Stackebrandtia sp. TaxID=2023065 RepID=UPI002D4A5B96|nr:hypothetical protein [Stackebrandtia sp.]HZE37360.1 hypothetical protein [Stackebrandtia sp.]
METYGDMMRRLDLRVSSPDNRIRARMHGDGFDIKFNGRGYREYTEPAMEGQLAALFQLLWVGRRKADLMAKAKTMGEEVAAESRNPSSLAGKELFAQRQRLEVGGTSSGGHVKVGCVGFRDWKVSLKRGTLDELSEDEFRAEVRSLASAVMGDYHHKLQPLLDEYQRRLDPEAFRRTKDLVREHGGSSWKVSAAR